jgi:hypothetical protein
VTFTAAVRSAGGLILVATLAAAGLVGAAGPAAADTLTVGGVVFHDRDADGHRDPGEPALPGLRVHHTSGTPATTTDAAGRYLLEGLPPSDKVHLQTGWLRSQCYDPKSQDCPAGPGDDNDFPTRNQLFEYPLTGAAAGTAAGDVPGVIEVNAALLPDWPGRGMAPPDPVRGVVAANSVDVAARLSSGPDTCVGALGICPAGATYERFGQLHNQGVHPITGLRAKLLVPPGDCLTAVTMVEVATSAGIGPMTTRPPAGDFDCDTRVVELAFPGTLVAAGAVRLSVTGTVHTGPGTPGCTLDAPPAATCGTGAPQGRALMLGVTHIAQHGDPDSTFCARGDLRRCATGLHDKRREPDDVDPAGHNIDAALGGTTDFNLQMAYARVGHRGPASIVHAGDEITVRGWVRNQLGEREPANQAHPGASIRFFLPAGSELGALPAPHSLRTCAQDAGPAPATGPAPAEGTDAARHWPTGPAVSVTCVYDGPVSPHVSSIAIDLVVRVPADWPVGWPYRTVACAAPVAGQAGERLPAAAAPCGPHTRPAATPTDNDAGLTLLVLPPRR